MTTTPQQTLKTPSSDSDDNSLKQYPNASVWTVFKRSASYEGRYLLHHSWDYVMLLWLPLLTVLGVWWIFSKPYITDLPIGVIDNSHSSYSNILVRYLDASPDLEVTGLYTNRAAANQAILAKKIYGVVIIPNDFADSINKGKPAPVIYKVNAQYGTHSGISQRGVQLAVGTLSAGVEIQRSIKKGTHTQQALINYSPIATQRISLFNAGGNYQQFLASTVIPSLLHILMMIIGATTIGRELRDRTLAVWYSNMTSPHLPYPNFAELKTIPPEQKLKYIYETQPEYLNSKPVEIESATTSNHPITINLDHKLEPIGANVNNNLINNESNEFTENDSNDDHKAVPQIPKNISVFALVFGLNGKLIWALLLYALWGALTLMLASIVHSSSMFSLAIVFVAYVALTMISLWLGAIFCLISYSLRMGLSSSAFISAPSYAFAGVTFPLMSMSEGAQRWANTLPLTHYLKIHITQLQMLAPHQIAYPPLIGLIVAVIVLLVVTALLCIRAFKHPLRWGAR